MKIIILSSFPEFFSGVFCSLINKALVNKIISIEVIDLKKHGTGKHKKIDDTPYGGGSGMILKSDVLSDALMPLIKKDLTQEIIITSPRGVKFNQKYAENFQSFQELIIITNRYEGVDQRVINYYNIKEISIGDYILMGGEVAATAIIESTIRLIPGVLGNKESLLNETNLSNNYIQYDQFTRPELWNNISIPKVLKSGNHQEIEKWRNENSKSKSTFK